MHLNTSRHSQDGVERTGTFKSDRQAVNLSQPNSPHCNLEMKKKGGGLKDMMYVNNLEQ